MLLKPPSKFPLSSTGEYSYSIGKHKTIHFLHQGEEERTPQIETLATDLGKHPLPNGIPLNKLQEKNYSRTLVPRYQIQELVNQRSHASIKFFSLFFFFFALIKHARMHTHTQLLKKKLLKSTSIKLEYFLKN